MKVVTIVAPASPVSLSEKKVIESFFKKEGFDVRFMPHTFEQERYLAGTDENRAADLNKALTDSQTDIVIALRGGYGSPRILDMLDYKAIKKANKKLFGFTNDLEADCCYKNRHQRRHKIEKTVWKIFKSCNLKHSSLSHTTGVPWYKNRYDSGRIFNRTA